MHRLMISAAPKILWLASSLVLLAQTIFSASVPLEVGSLPTIALVPGAWHSPIHYADLLGNLRRAGYDTITQRLPSCNSSNPEAQSVAADAVSIRENLLLPPLNAAKPVVLIMHSYGGSPGAMAARGLSMVERRAAGKGGGVIGLIFICALVAHEGQSLRNMLPGDEFDPWVVQYDDGQLGVRNAKEVFYNDVTEVVANMAIGELRNQSRNSLETPSGPPAWKDLYYNGRRAYAHTLLDNGIPPIGQNIMLQQSGVQWDVKNFNTGHSPFLSQPQQLHAWLLEEIQKFVGDPMDQATTS